MEYLKDILLKSLLLIILVLQTTTYAMAASFYDHDNLYRGFYWFEKQEVKAKNKINTEYQMPTPSEAEAAIEAQKKLLDDARNQMVAVGLDLNAPMSAKRQAIINYKKLEMKMWDGALSIGDAADMANFTNPELSDNLKQPTNVFGVKLKRQLEDDQNKLLIMEFAGEFDLLLFASDSCRYCREFAPILKRFVSEHQFQLDVSSLDSEAGGMARKLGITGIPTLIAVKRDGSMLFEVSRGLVSMSELEANILLAKKYSEELKAINGKTRKSQIKKLKITNKEPV